ncbi:hypothetical protein CSOJ01_01275 [Colletotrichum sojae]|uniref:Uncharacterized protein n=1 Tax=Colletotrichum sojae TaxID=2175907 RepID=A0A8H6JUW0_9PEZI|nr:hypothetical protein CSOJ01_01275 [Colletotrichum sojae]
MGSENRSPALRYWAITDLNNARARPRNSGQLSTPLTVESSPSAGMSWEPGGTQSCNHFTESHPSVILHLRLDRELDTSLLAPRIAGGTGSLEAIERVSSLLARQARSPTRRELQFNQTRDAANAQSAGSRFFFARHAVMARRRVASPTTLKSPPVPARRHRRVIQRFIDWEVAWTDRRESLAT